MEDAQLLNEPAILLMHSITANWYYCYTKQIGSHTRTRHDNLMHFNLLQYPCSQPDEAAEDTWTDDSQACVV